MMMKKASNSIIFCLLIASVFIIQCEKDKADNLKIDFIRYGTFFGECLGYCYRQIEISESKLTFIANGYDLSGILPERSCSYDITSVEWDAINSNIDFDSFNALPETIGCPDCADGGAEWIEISMKGETHKVTFEFGSEPQEVKSYIQLLRNYMPENTNCQ